MPRMNGLELCKRIKENAELGYIPVILLTSRVDDPSMEQSYKTGADAYVQTLRYGFADYTISEYFK